MVEGQVTKLIKRQGYSREGFPLLAISRPSCSREEQVVIWRKRSNIGDNLRTRLASRFSLAPHLGKARNCGGVTMLLRWEALSRLPTGKVRGPGRSLCSLSVSWLRSSFSPWALPLPGRGSCPPKSRRACGQAGTPPCPC